MASEEVPSPAESLAQERTLCNLFNLTPWLKPGVSRSFDEQFVQQVVGQIPWGHNVYLLDTVKEEAERAWYAYKTIENGWSRAVLMHQVESGLYRRQGKALTNFATTLPAPDSELTQQVLKDPYNFDFLTLKITEFQPEHGGKMNFYLSAVDAQLRHPTDQPSIGIILCKSRDRLIVEYALRDMNKPIGVSEYYLNLLPDQLASILPTVEELEAELGPDASVDGDSSG